jgi:hypothetical protein
MNIDNGVRPSRAQRALQGRCCQTCQWHDVDGLYNFYGKRAEGMGDLGFCRRYPPRPSVERLENVESRMANFVFGDFPETAEDDWCGEWSGREAQ